MTVFLSLKAQRGLVYTFYMFLIFNHFYSYMPGLGLEHYKEHVSPRFSPFPTRDFGVRTPEALLEWLRSVVALSKPTWRHHQVQSR